MPLDKITFTGHGGDALAARFDRPDGATKAVALFAHCFTCSKDIAAARRIAARLAGLGIAVLRFDFTGLGHSQGEFANTHFSSNVGDPRGREFELWAVDTDGSNLERITYSRGFDGFPMFSPDGKGLAFGSNRNQRRRGETNVFVARWVDKRGKRRYRPRVPAGRYP